MIDFVGRPRSPRCGGRADAFMSVAAERGKKVCCPEGGGGKRGEAELQSPSVQIDIDKYWPFIPLLSQRIMYGGNNNNSSLLVDMDIILDGVERKAAWVMSDITVCFWFLQR